MTTHFELHNVLYQLQHGVRHGRSCETQLLELTTTLQANLNTTAQTDLVIMDFSKAFDGVCHNKLLAKLDFYGVRSDILHWISCFLDSRQQCVMSRWRTVPIPPCPLWRSSTLRYRPNLVPCVHIPCSLGPVYEFVCISFRTDNLNRNLPLFRIEYILSYYITLL